MEARTVAAAVALALLIGLGAGSQLMLRQQPPRFVETLTARSFKRCGRGDAPPQAGRGPSPRAGPNIFGFRVEDVDLLRLREIVGSDTTYAAKTPPR